MPRPDGRSTLSGDRLLNSKRSGVPDVGCHQKVLGAGLMPMGNEESVVYSLSLTISRAIDDVLTKNKERTGQVRCLECGVIFDDPSLEQT